MKICIHCRSKIDDGWACPSCRFSPPIMDGIPLIAPPLAEAEGGFAADAFEELYALEEKHFWFRARNELLTWAIRALFPGARRILEVGCGTGFVLAHLERAFPEASFVGGEAFREALAFAKSRLRRTELLRIDVRDVPFVEEFDLACAFDVLEHVPDDEAALRSLFQATKRGGGVLLTVPQHRWLWSKADETAHHVRRYTRRELVSKIERAGFSVVRTTSFVSALLPVMVASRLAQKLSRTPEAASAREYAPPRLVNAAFRTILAFERGIIRGGISLPAGGSLLVAARRPA